MSFTGSESTKRTVAPQRTGASRSSGPAEAFAAAHVREIGEQDPVFRDEPDQEHGTDQKEQVERLVRECQCSESADDRDRHRKHDDERRSVAVVERDHQQIHEHESNSANVIPTTVSPTTVCRLMRVIIDGAAACMSVAMSPTRTTEPLVARIGICSIAASDVCAVCG
jgi:hypothetical protein